MDTATLQQAERSVTRRRLVAFVGWGSFVTFWGSIVLATLRFFFPRILYESPRRGFRLASQRTIRSERSVRASKGAQRVWMIRNADDLYALIAICTHLGCTPNWFASEHRFKCPCHGSNFLMDGTNVAGPAPVPLYQAAIALDLAGTIEVDKSQRENQPGKRDQPPFFLPLPPYRADGCRVMPRCARGKRGPYGEFV